MEGIKEKIETYISSNKMRRTKERCILIEKVSEMKDFDVKELLKHAEEKEISKPSVYFFIDLLVKIGILKIQERYVWNKK